MLYPKLTARLIIMREMDQEMREKAASDSSSWDPALDKKHTAQLKRIIAKYGWPTKTLVGREAAQSAWLIAQHADQDVDFQKSCLTMMKALPSNEVPLQDIAYLEDRVLVAEHKPQLYGTQFQGSGKDMRPQPTKDRENIDKRRAKMGLGLFAEYEKLMADTYQ
jgi:hypothetical protein